MPERFRLRSTRVPKPPLRQIAASLDAPPALAPHIAALFADLSSLGSMPRKTARLLKSAGLRPRHRVLDLACGKGSVAVELAARIGCRVTALDAFPPFIDAARTLAARRNVSHLCTFRLANLRDPRSLPRRPFDAAVMLGLDPLAIAAPLLRRIVRPRGLYLIDDCFRDPRYPVARAFAHVPTRDDSRRVIQALGDTVETCHIPTPSVIRRLDTRLYRSIRTAARSIQRTNPNLAPALRDFLARHRRAHTLLTGPLRPAIWLIRRGR